MHRYPLFFCFFFFNDTATTEIYTLSLHDALPVVDRAMGPVRQALADAQLSPKQIEEVVLVGGTTRTPLIRRTVREFFDRKPHAELNPDEVVALGAAGAAHARYTGGRT